MLEQTELKTFSEVSLPIKDIESTNNAKEAVALYSSNTEEYETIWVNFSSFEQFDYSFNDIIFRNKKEITEFIEIYPELNNVINETQKIIHQYFSSSEIALELVFESEPELVGGEKILFLYVITDLSVGEAYANLKKIDEKIFDELKFNSEFFNINLEFKS